MATWMPVMAAAPSQPAESSKHRNVSFGAPSPKEPAPSLKLEEQGARGCGEICSGDLGGQKAAALGEARRDEAVGDGQIVVEDVGAGERSEIAVGSDGALCGQAWKLSLTV